MSVFIFLARDFKVWQLGRRFVFYFIIDLSFLCKSFWNVVLDFNCVESTRFFGIFSWVYIVQASRPSTPVNAGLTLTVSNWTTERSS